MKNKKVLIYSTILVATAGALYYIFGPKKEPKFEMGSISREFSFADFKVNGKEVVVNNKTAGQISARGGYSVKYGKDGDSYSIDLYKNGKYIRNLNKFVI